MPIICPSNVQCQLYADDAVIYVHAKNTEQAAHKLTAAMDSVSEYLERSQLVLNLTKTVCMFFSKKACDKNTDSMVSIQGQKLTVVQEFKYLGVVIDSQLNFKQQVKKNSKQIEI